MGLSPSSDKHDASSFIWDVAVLGPVCCVMHVKEPSALIKKRRGSPLCSWYDLAAYWCYVKGVCLIIQNIVPHTLQEKYCMLKRLDRVTE